MCPPVRSLITLAERVALDRDRDQERLFRWLSLRFSEP
ncbi:MAG: hypothetical protein JWL61_1876 [Gemmatimonadetes bacterium]|jgi:hypothetical protein|nr:hypothetical protein [Gemmatimonadota bacterium]